MYIKKVTKKKSASGKPYEYLHLVENIRTEKGPRQRLILNLGALDIPKSQYKALANSIEGKLHGISLLFDDKSSKINELADQFVSKIRSKNTTIMDSSEEDEPARVPTSTSVDVVSIGASECRSIGAEYVAHEMWNKLGFNKILKMCDVSPLLLPLLEAQVVGRLIAPGSEAQTHDWLQSRSALYELTGTPIQNSLSSFYRAADHLFKYKESLEAGLRDNERRLYQLDEKLCLFDLTNTYFEGTANSSSKAARGRSKEKRTDCKLITLALVVDDNGFAKHSELFAGNQPEAETLPAMIEKLLPHYQSNLLKPTVIVDAGIASQENIDWLKEQKLHYIVVSRTDRDLMPEDGMVVVRKDKDQNIDIAVQRNVEDDEVKLLCYSRKRSYTSKSIRLKQEEKYVERLAYYQSGLSIKRRAKTYGRLQFMLGRLAQNNPKVACLYDVKVVCEKSPKSPEKAKVLDIVWTRKEVYDEREARDGCYVLRTDRTDLSDREIWETYVTLTRVEKSFRGLKSSLGLRPNYHRDETRIDAHMFISVMAYHLMNAIEYEMRKADDHRGWDTLHKVLSTHQRLTIEYREVLADGQWKQRAVRTCSRPEEAHKQIYKTLGLKCIPLPKYLSKSK